MSGPRNLDSIRPREHFPGFSGQMLHTDHVTLAYWTIAEGAVLPEHSHPHEQVVNMFSGEMELTVSGETMRLRGGDIFAIPGGAPHSGRALTEVKVLDVFSPVREDYLNFHQEV